MATGFVVACLVAGCTARSEVLRCPHGRIRALGKGVAIAVISEDEPERVYPLGRTPAAE